MLSGKQRGIFGIFPQRHEGNWMRPEKTNIVFTRNKCNYQYVLYKYLLQISNNIYEPAIYIYILIPAHTLWWDVLFVQDRFLEIL